MPRSIHLQGQAPDDPLPPKGGRLYFAATAATALLAALGFGLYSRFNSRAQALRSETRKRLLALVESRPGLSVTEAAEAMGLARNAIQHHVRILERVGVVRVAMEGSLKAIYPAGAPLPELPPWLRRNRACLLILRALQANPAGLTREEVHRLLSDVPERTRNHHLQRLLSAGALVQGEDKRLRAASSWGPSSDQGA